MGDSVQSNIRGTRYYYIENDPHVRIQQTCIERRKELGNQIAFEYRIIFDVQSRKKIGNMNSN